MDRRMLTVGLLAHVDAGKTTLAEGMLYLSGQLRKLGRVDHRDAFLDTNAQERERGITIFSKQAVFSWKNLDITLVDTPGHVDFSSEMERALSILDCAVLVISGSSGVQAHTVTLWRLCEAYNVPLFIFVNKMDQPGCDRTSLAESIKSRLSDAIVDMLDDGAMEHIALGGEDALSQFLECGKVFDDTISRMVESRNVFPCYFGSALKISGIDSLLDALSRYTIEKNYADEFSARVYKISRDGDARLTCMKITGGSLRVRDSVSGPDGDWEEKVSGIRLYSGKKFTSCDEVKAGQVCAVTGLGKTRAGDGLGADAKAAPPLMESVFTYRILPPSGCDPFTLMQKLRILEEEDPQLQVVWNESNMELYVQLMGEVQLEILSNVILERFGLKVSFGAGSILYRETISAPVIGVGHYEPLKHYAEVRLLLEPAPRGSGVTLATACSEDVLERSWQRLILTHLGERRHAGVLTGSGVTDIKITLLAGRAHLKHTEGGDFRQATYRAVRQGLMGAKNILLEPWYDIRLEIPSECVGRAMNDIGQMGGGLDFSKTVGDFTYITGSAPVAKARYYAKDVAVYTRGRGRFSCSVSGYQPCPDQDKIVAQIGYDPERDVLNPADSVFCSHGAGYVVKWSQAQAHMHIAPERVYAPTDAEKLQKPRQTDSEKEEEELARIFERTFGPVKRSLFRPTPVEQPTVGEYQMKDLENELLIVDGYNVIFAWDELKKAANDSLEAARQSLMDILCNFRGFRQAEITLVFDAYKAPGRVGASEDYKNIHVVYTKQGETADQFIEKTVFDIGKKRRVRVATSDRLEQIMVLGDGALRVSASELHAEVMAANIEISAILRDNSLKYGKSRSMEHALREALRKKET